MNDYELRALNDRYFSQLSLDRLERKSSGRYQFRCPICGDSQKSSKKRRGWYYPDSGTFSCYNCHHNKRFMDAFLREVAPYLVDDYEQERKTLYIEALREEHGMVSEEEKQEKMAKLRVQNPNFDAIKEPKKGFLRLDAIPAGAIKIADLERTHPARIFVGNRKIPKKYAMQLYWCYDDDLFGQRVIVPFIDEKADFTYGFQARRLDGRNPKYLTFAVPGQTRVWGIHNVDWTKPVYVLEGAIDAMFIPNSIAAAGSHINESELKEHKPQDLRFIFDNCWLDKTGKQRSIEIAMRGHTVFVWPKDCMFKDVNDCVLNNYKLPVYDESYYFTGAEAAVRLQM